MPRVVARLSLDKALQERFKAQFPGRGSLAWLVETAMAELLAVTEGQPDLKTLVRSATRASLLRELQSNRARANAKRPTDPITVHRLVEQPPEIQRADRSTDGQHSAEGVPELP